MTESFWKNFESKKAIYDSELENLKEEFDNTKRKQTRQKEASLDQAYVSRKLSERDLPALMSAMGMHGGIAETTAARLKNSYDNNRQALESAYADSIGDLTLQYTGKRNNLLSKISAAKMEAEAKILEEQARLAALAIRKQTASKSGQGSLEPAADTVRGSSVLSGMKKR